MSRPTQQIRDSVQNQMENQLKDYFYDSANLGYPQLRQPAYSPPSEPAYLPSSVTNPYSKMREAAYSGLGNQYSNVQIPRPYSPPMQFSPRYNPPMGGMYGGGKGGGNMYGMGGYRPAAPYSAGRYGNTMTGMGSYGMPSFKGGYSPFGYGGGIGQSIYGTMGNMQSPFPHGAYFLTPGGALGGMPQYQQQQYYGTTDVHPITGAVNLPPNTGNNV